MDKKKIEQAKSDYQKVVSFIEDGSPIPPKNDPYWDASAALERLHGFFVYIDGVDGAVSDVLDEPAVSIKQINAALSYAGGNVSLDTLRKYETDKYVHKLADEITQIIKKINGSA